MEFFEVFFKEGLFLVSLAELLAMLSGWIYLKKAPYPAKGAYIFVAYLTLIFIIETIGFYPAIAYFSNYEIFGFLKGSAFARNEWLYNIFDVIEKSMLFWYFSRNIKWEKFSTIISWLIPLYYIFCIANLYYSGTFFSDINNVNYVLGTFLLLFCIATYFLEVLNSDRILAIKHQLITYVAASLMIWNLCITPLVIFFAYVTVENIFFVKVYFWTIRISNIFLYSIFAFAFYIDYKYSAKKNILSSETYT